jgi:hypothetical protein
MDFSKIWSTGGTLTQPTDGQFEQGFGFLGQAPPSEGLFNWMFNDMHLKLQVLNNLSRQWRALTAYSVGDIIYSETAASYKYMECTTAGITAAIEPVWPEVGATVTDGTATWVVRDIRAGEQVGSIKAWLANAAPPGWLALDTGALVSRATYPQLWVWVQAYAPLITEAAWQAQAAVQSSVGAYSSGDGSTTFRLPRLVDYFRGGSAAEVGSWQSDQPIEHKHISPVNDNASTLVLQNARGSTWPHGSGETGQPGCLNSPAGTYIASGEDLWLYTGGVVPINGETRPKTIKVLYCVKAFDAPTNQGLVDITELANEVAGKGPAFQGVSVYRGSGGNQSIAAGTTAKIALNTVNLDTNSFWDTGNARLKIPAGVNRVSIIGSVEWPDNFTTANTGRAVFIYKNGSSIAASSHGPLNGSLVQQVVAPFIPVAENDYFELYVKNSDTAAKIITANANTYLALEVLA